MIFARRRIEPLEPSEENEVFCRRAFSVFGPPSDVYLAYRAPYSASGLSDVPEEPALFLANHVGIVDPWLVIMSLRRPVHFMATESAFNDPFFGRVLWAFGSISKKKFTSDVSAVRTMKRWKDAGGHVGVFPEGQRSWDGALQPLLPGIESLVRLLGLPVVTVRMINIDRQGPRWARYMRRGRVHLEFDPPVRFDRKTPPETIRAHVEARLQVDLERCQRWPVKGSRLARGLANPVFACPRCFRLDGLHESDEEVECKACGARWGVTTTNEMQAISSRTNSHTVADAMRRVRDHYMEVGLVGDMERYRNEGIILRSVPMVLLDITDTDPVHVAHGRLQLTESHIELVEATTPFCLPLGQVAAISVDLRRRLLVRGPDRLYEAVLPQESALKWEWIGQHWRARAQARSLPVP